MTSYAIPKAPRIGNRIRVDTNQLPETLPPGLALAEGLTPGQGEPDLVRVALYIGYRDGGRAKVGKLARLLFMSRRAMSRRLAKAGHPSPRHLLKTGALCRVWHEARGLRKDGRLAVATGAASRAGYPDLFTFSNQLKREAGVRPRGLLRLAHESETPPASILARMLNKGAEAPPVNARLYAEGKGRACPACGERPSAPEGGTQEADPGQVWQDTACASCGATWRAVYVLAGYENLTR